MDARTVERIACWAIVLASSMDSVAQVRPDHDAGQLLPAFIDGDRSEDFLVDTGRGLHAWFGQAGAPWLQRGASTEVPADPKSGKALAGGHLYFLEARSPAQRGMGYAARLAVWRLAADGSLSAVTTHLIAPSSSTALVSRVHVAPSGFDLDGDGAEDVCAVWREELLGVPGATLRGAWLAPTRRGPACDLQWAGSSAIDLAVAGLHATRHVGNAVGDVLCTVTEESAGGSGGGTLGGFGFVQLSRSVSDQMSVGGVRWIGGVPEARVRHGALATPSVVYGGFQPSPQLAVPLVRTTLGPTVVMHPDLRPPFVDAQGALLHTGPGIDLVGHRPADFDGDGADEVVFLLRGFWSGQAMLVVSDPHPRATPRWEAHWWSGSWTQASRRSLLQDAAPVDVDGDGDADLVVSGNWNGYRHSDLALLRQDALPGGVIGSSLRRIF